MAKAPRNGIYTLNGQRYIAAEGDDLPRGAVMDGERKLDGAPENRKLDGAPENRSGPPEPSEPQPEPESEPGKKGGKSR